MITLLENVEHQVTVLGTGLIAEGSNVDVTGFRLLDKPVVEINADGSVTLRIAVPDDVPAPKKRSKTEHLNNET